MILDDAYRLVYANDELYRISGYSPKEVIGQDFRKFLDEDSKKLVAERYIRRQRGEEVPPRYEFNIIRKDGQKRRVEISSAVIKDSAGEVRTIAQILDITERKQAEEALQTEKNKLQSLIDAMEDGLSIQDRDYNIIYQNEPSRIASGGDHTGEKCYRVYEGKEEVGRGCPVKMAFKDGKSHTAERRRLEPSGEVTVWENTASPIRDAKGKIVSCLEVTRNITERKQAEEAFQAEKNKLQSVVDAMEYGLTIQDRDYNIIYEGTLQRTIFGDHVGEKCYRVYEGKERVCRGCPVKMAFKDGKSHTVERRTVAPSGEVIFWENTASPIRDAKGKIVSCLEIARNITERKQAEEALRESQKFSSSLLESSPNPISVINPDTSVRYVNPAFEKLTGFTLAEIVGKKAPYPWWPEGKRKEITAAFKKTMARGGRRTERNFQKKNGERFWVALNSAPVMHKGKPIYFLLSWLDITEHKQAEEKLQESEDYLKTIFDASTGGILIIEPETHKIVDANPAIIKMFGLDSKKIIGHVCYQFVCPQELGQCPVTDLKQRVDTKECVFLNAEGEEIPALKSVVPITRHGREYLLELIFDIAERKRAEEKEKQLQQELYLARRLASVGELAAGVAHEINNPLTGVLGFSQRLMRKSTNEELSRDLEIIHSEARRAAEVVRNLLTFARRRQPKKEYSDINDIVQKTLELRGYALQTSNIEVVTDLAPSLPQIMVDFSQMQEVFLNIILNAEQAMNEAHGKGKLIIKTRQMKDYVRVSFADDGPGIAPESLDKVFDPFFTTRAEGGGTGLGLSACHGIVTEHGGRIYVRSKPGKGATFFVELPLSPVEATVGH
jgi:PAS domain S-box-containing protein